MECPHCRTGFHEDNRIVFRFAKDGPKSYYAISRICPVCKEITVHLRVELEQAETHKPATTGSATCSQRSASRNLHLKRSRSIDGV